MKHPRTLGSAFDAGRAGRHDNFLLLRIAAASLVIYGHSFFLARPDGSSDVFARFFGIGYAGDLAVSAFFLMSGFLVAGSLERRPLGGFVVARLARLLPGLGLCLVLTALVFGALVTTRPLAEYLLAPQVWQYIGTNLSLVEAAFQLPGVFEGNRYGPAVNGSLWTLPVEARMYLALALGGLLLATIPRAWWAPVACVALLAWIVIRLQITLPVDRSAERLAWCFVAGAFAYLLRDRIPLSAWVLASLAAVAWLARDTALYELALSVCVSYAVFWIAYVPVVHLPRWVGDISYGTYLYGFPVQQCIASLWADFAPMAMTLAALPVAWLLAALSWTLVERPALDAVQAASRRAPVTASVSRE